MRALNINWVGLFFFQLISFTKEVYGVFLSWLIGLLLYVYLLFLFLSRLYEGVVKYKVMCRGVSDLI